MFISDLKNRSCFLREFDGKWEDKRKFMKMQKAKCKMQNWQKIPFLHKTKDFLSAIGGEKISSWGR